MNPRILFAGQRKFVTHQESGRSSQSTSFISTHRRLLFSPWGKDPKSIYSILREVDEVRMAQLVFECSSGSGLIT
jgi:hypothetical protein